MNKKIVGFGIAVAALVAVAGGQQAQAAQTAAMTLEIEDYTTVNVTNGMAFAVHPTLEDIGNNVVAESAPIELTIESSAGSIVSWAGDGVGGAGKVLDADIKLALAGGTFVPEGVLRTSAEGTTPEQGVTQDIDVQISNLQNYAIGNHTNTLTFSIIAD